MRLASLLGFVTMGLLAGALTVGCGGQEAPPPFDDVPVAGSGGSGGTGGGGLPGRTDAGLGGTGGSQDASADRQATDATATDAAATDAVVTDAAGDAAAGDVSASDAAEMDAPAIDAPEPDAAEPDSMPDVEVDAPPPIPPQPWIGLDIGDVGMVASSTTYNDDLITVTTAGAGIGGIADSFHFIHHRMVGDGEVVARINTMRNSDPMAKAGVMFRGGVGPGVRNVFLTTVGDQTVGGWLQYRSEPNGATTVGMSDPAIKLTQYLKIERRGDNFRAYRSGNRVSWALVGEVTVNLPNEALVGLATESHSAQAVTPVGVAYLLINNLASSTTFQSWEHVEIGTLGGIALANGTSLKLTGFGDRFTGTRDFFTFALTTVTGPWTLTARVANMSSVEPLARGGLTFREGQPTGNPRDTVHATVSATPGGVMFESRALQGAQAVQGQKREDLLPPVWLRLQKADVGVFSHFVSATSLNGTTWTELDRVVLNVAQPIMVGLIAGASSRRDLNTVDFEQVKLEMGGPPIDGGPPDASPDAATDVAQPDANPDAAVDAVSAG